MNKLIDIKSPIGNKLSCKGWQQEAAYRMLQNNLAYDVAEKPDELIVYGGYGKAARNWQCIEIILKSFKNLDTNMDGEISPDEIARAYKVLKKSGKITKEEFNRQKAEILK